MELVRKVSSEGAGRSGPDIGRLRASSLERLFGWVLRYPVYSLRSCFVFKRPFHVIRQYVMKAQPEPNVVWLRSGLRLFLSDHPHDIVTAFVVFAKRDYGAVAPNSIVVDIGANIGAFAVYAASRGAKKVYAYEPNPEAYAVLRRNIESNGLENVIVAWQLAVSSVTNGQVLISRKASPYNQIFPVGLTNCESELVETVSLTSIITDHVREPVDLVKIDCEGAEFDILLRSKQNVLGLIRNIRLEYHAGPVDDLVKHLQEHDFRLVHLNRDSAVMWFENRRG